MEHMTTIGTILAKNPDLSPEGTGPETASMDGAFAIFTAILANMSAQDDAISVQNEDTPELNAEELFDQIIADDSVSPYISPADRKDLLPILDNILENPDRITSVIDLHDAHAIWSEISSSKKDIIAQIMPDNHIPEDKAPSPDIEDPVAGMAAATITPPAQVTGRIFASAPISRPASALRENYNTARNPVQALASLIRKITPATVQPEKSPTPSSMPAVKPVTADPAAIGPFPKDSASPWVPAAKPVTADPAAIGPFPKDSASPWVPAAKPSSINPTVNAPLPRDSVITEEASHRLSAPKSPAMTQSVEKAAENTREPEIPFVKPALLKKPTPASTVTAKDHEALAAKVHLSGQQPAPDRTSPAPSVAQANVSAPIMGGGDFNGQFSQQQQPQSGLDTTMGLDQGRDARLLRLSVSENGWQDRLIRHIHTSNNGGKDQTITVMLQPRKLGRLTLNISVSGNATTVNIVASSTEAAALLQDSETRLQQAFDQNGLKLTSMQTSAQQGGQQNQQGSGRSAGSGGAHNAPKETSSDENSSTKIQENANNSQINILA